MAEKDAISDAKEQFSACVEHEADNRSEALDDLRFARLGEQWPDAVKRARDKDARPCLTINRLPSFIRQVVNDARQNKPSIKVHPSDSDADPHTAEIYNGLIRNIEAQSRAPLAYDTALDFAVTMGWGFWRVNTGYACDDTFDLDLLIERVSNPFCIYGDPYSDGADSSDWNIAFDTELLTREEFRRKYKGAQEVSWEQSGYEGMKQPWADGKKIVVARYWRREKVARTILLLADQRMVPEDVFNDKRDVYAAAVVVGARKVPSYRVTHSLMTGAEVLEGPEKWAGRYIPIVPVYGEEVNVEGRRYFRSMIRDTKDAQRMFNYWRSASTELVALAPKAPFIGPVSAFETEQHKWVSANSESHAYIGYDGNIPPQRQSFAGIPAGALQEALNASDDLKSIMGMYDASLGARSNETSGRAILARQREGDISTFHFIDNLSRAIEHTGRILIDLIPTVYSGQRVVRVLGAQGQAANVPLGTPVPVIGENGAPAQDPNTGLMMSRIYDLGVGKYDLTVETGPSFTTRREEAASQMIELIRAYPAVAPLIGDLLAKNLDWPGADEIAKRLSAFQTMQMQAHARSGQHNDASQAQSGLDPRVLQYVQQLQQEIGQLSAKLKATEQDRTIDAEKLKVDAYDAETKRMKVVTEARRGMVSTYPI